MSSQSFYAESHNVSESFSMWTGINPEFNEQTQNDMNRGDVLTLSEESKILLEEMERKIDDVLNDDESATLDQKTYLTKLILEAVFKEKIEILDVSDLNREAYDRNLQRELDAWGMEYEYHESHYEYEETNFEAEGIIKTQDGKEIHFNLNVKLSREYYSEQHLITRTGTAVDPLVINFDGLASALTDTKFLFDLNSDGKDENISFVRPGSGFLVFDKNNDEIVNDGSELFGPTTGNGFQELISYDEDNNGWIDENDSIYDRLSVWYKDKNGNDYLEDLKSKNVGAIYLASSQTSFSFMDSTYNISAKMNSSGIYLKENGSVGTINQLDLVV